MTEAPSPYREGNRFSQYAWDATSLSGLMQCPRNYYYESICGYREGSDHLIFGHAYHAALEDYDRSVLRALPFEQAVRSALRMALTETVDWEPEAGQNYKTRRTLLRAVYGYIETFHDNPMKAYVFADGTEAIELSFTVPLDDDVIICGHMDGLLDYGDGTIFVRERKTTKSALSAYYINTFSPDPQFSNYAMAARALYPHLKIQGIILDACQVGVTFSRYTRHQIKRTVEQSEEWLDTANFWIAQAREMAEKALELDEAGYDPVTAFPMNETACGKYGGCQFRAVCSRSPSVRHLYLKDFDVQFWNPLEVR